MHHVVDLDVGALPGRFPQRVVFQAGDVEDRQLGVAGPARELRWPDEACIRVRAALEQAEWERLQAWDAAYQALPAMAVVLAERERRYARAVEASAAREGRGRGQQTLFEEVA